MIRRFFRTMMQSFFPYLLTALVVLLVAAFALPPKPKPTAFATIAVACSDASCKVKATWKLHPSFNATTDSVRLEWTQASPTAANLGIRYTKLSADSVTVTRGAVDKLGKVVATVWRKGVTEPSPAAEAAWTAPAAPPAPVDSLKTQVGALLLPSSISVAANASQQGCGYALWSDGSRTLVSGPGCSP